MQIYDKKSALKRELKQIPVAECHWCHCHTQAWVWKLDQDNKMRPCCIKCFIGDC